MTNLYLTLLDRIGVHPEQLGDSTGRVEHLRALDGDLDPPDVRLTFYRSVSASAPSIFVHR